MVDQGTSAARSADKAPGAHTAAYTPTSATLGPPASVDGPASGHSSAFPESRQQPPWQLPFSPRDPIRAATDEALATWAAESVKSPAAADAVNIPSAADSHGSSGGSNDQTTRDNQDFKAAMAGVRDGLRQLLETEERPEWRERISRLISQADTQTADADELLQAGTGQPPDRAFRLAAGHTALADDVEDAQAEAEDDKESIWDKIKRWLRKAGRKLWAMISRLVTVKEWTLTGTAGGSVLGLAQASISVTFGSTARDTAGTGG